VLDVGTGPGYVAAQAAERSAVATGVDIADEMVALARRRHAGVSFRRADAEELPFPDRSFDALVGNLVINHLPRPEQAVGEFARVLAPGGAMALSTWDVPENTRFLGILRDALRVCGVADGEATGPDPFRFAGDDEFRGLLRGVGLDDVEVRHVELSHRVADADELWRGLLGGSVRTAGLVMRQPPSTRQRIRETVAELAEDYRVEGGLDIPGRAKIARGTKP
jgi:SAM-dependent methyltransferase